MHALRDTAPWQDGWLLHPEPAAAPPRPGFRLLAVPGEVTANTGRTPWRLVLRWRQDVEDLQAGCLAHGFVIASGGETVMAHVAAPTTLCGILPAGCEARLVGASAPTQGGEQQAWIERPGHTVALVQEPSGNHVRWALAWTDADSHQALVLARAALLHDASAAWSALRTRRASLLERVATEGGDRQALIAAIEVLLGAIRPPDSVFPGHWLDTRDNPPGMDIGTALLALPALARLEPAAAADIFDTILRVTAEDRDLHALVSHDPTAEVAASPLPLAASVAQHIAREGNDPTFVARALPRLIALLERQLDHATRADGLVGWHSSAESLLPDLYDDEVTTPDATALLAAEIDALLQLAEPYPDYEERLGRLATWRETVPDQLRRSFWHEESKTLRGRFADGRHIKRATAADAMPLLCADLGDDLRAAALRLVAPGSPLRSDNGIRDWERWTSDTDDPSVSAHIQLLVLRALSQHGPADQANALARTLASTTMPMPEDGEILPLVDAALLLELRAGLPSGTAQRRQGTPLLDLLDRHRGGVLATAIALTVGLCAAFVVPAYLKTEPTESVLEVQLGDAEMRYSERDYRGAMELFEKLKATALRDPRNLDARVGDCWYRLEDWTRAEEAYRGALARNPDQPKAWMNRALTLFRLGRFADAAKEYREFIRIFGPLYPDLKSRAETALTLCEEQAGRKP